MRSIRLALLLAAPFVSATAQQVPLRDLPKPSREIAEPFSMISQTAEFRPGQLIVADATDAEVTLVDFATGTRTVLGRKGAGPGEYTLPVGIIRLTGDTIVVLDATGGGGTTIRAVRFLPDLKSGTTSMLTAFNTQDTTTLQGAIFADAKGQMYSTAVRLTLTPQGPMPTDTMYIVRFPLAVDAKFTKLDAIRTPQGGKREQSFANNAIKIKLPYFGVVNADAWAAFPDGRVAVLRGTNYTIEFIAPDGKRTPPLAIPYERIKLTEADRAIELTTFRKVVSDQMTVMKKAMPPNITFDLEITPPAAWPSEYPPFTLLGALSAPNGNVWVRRSVPSRLDREQWDVISPAGRLVARWQLPPKTSLTAIGTDAVYAVRTDEDDLRYVQRIPVPR